MGISWGKGVFSKELAGVKLKELQDHFVGHNIICDDGVTRKCEELIGSIAWPWKFIVNEQDPSSNGGHFVNALLITAQFLNKPLPSKDACVAFERAMRIRFAIKEDGTFDKPPRLSY